MKYLIVKLPDKIKAEKCEGIVKENACKEAGKILKFYNNLSRNRFLAMSN
jgi:hypothetical protein